jgi:protein-L-isoaspartate(D-aspartate) O-methyltransferase
MTGWSADEERAQFMLLMRARGIRDLNVLRALERAPRALFMPQRYADISGRDIALPIGCGQTAPPPSVVAAMIEALTLAPEHRVLEIGSGTGYCAALLAQLTAEVLSVERCQSLAVEAATRLESLRLTNARIAWADGLMMPSDAGPFDRIIVHGLIGEVPESLEALLANDGVLVAARAGSDGLRDQRINRLTRNAEGWHGADSGPARSFAALATGLTRSL